MVISFIVTLLFVSFCISNSFFQLNGDNLNIAAFIFPAVHPDIYVPEINNPSPLSYYLPAFTEILIYIYKTSGSYIVTLKIMMGLYMFLSLVMTYLFMMTVFRSMGHIWYFVCSYLFIMPFSTSPSHELWGFMGLYAAIGRNAFLVFMPLLMSILYCRVYIQIGQRRISTIVILLAFIGILFPLHPISAGCTAIVFCVYWLAFRHGIPLGFGHFFRKVLPLIYGIIIFIAIASILYLFPLLNQEEKQKMRGAAAFPAAASVQNGDAFPAGSPLPSEYIPKTQSVLKIPSIREHFSCYGTLKVFFYIPSLLAFLYLIYIRRLMGSKNELIMYRFFFGFFAASFLCTISALLIFDNLGYSHIFYVIKRIDRVLLFASGLSLIFSAYVMLRREKGLFTKAAHASGIVILWCGVAKTKGLIYYPLMSSYLFPSVQNIEFRSYLLAIITSILALGIIVYSRYYKSPRVFRLCGYALSLLILCWSLITGGIFVAGACFMDATAGLGSWKLANRFVASLSDSLSTNFDTAVLWAKNNTPAKDRFLYLDKTMSQHMKFASFRQGLSLEEDEIGLTPYARQETKKILESVFAEDYNSLFALADKNGIKWIFASAHYATHLQSRMGSRCLVRYKNEYYSIIEIIKPVP